MQKKTRTTKTKRAVPKGRLEGQLRAYGGEILQKMAQLAQEGDVRAASLIFKFLEKEESDDSSKTFAAIKRQLAGLQADVVGEIISLLAEADARAKTTIVGLEPPK